MHLDNGLSDERSTEKGPEGDQEVATGDAS